MCSHSSAGRSTWVSGAKVAATQSASCQLHPGGTQRSDISFCIPPPSDIGHCHRRCCPRREAARSDDPVAMCCNSPTGHDAWMACSCGASAVPPRSCCLRDGCFSLCDPYSHSPLEACSKADTGWQARFACKANTNTEHRRCHCHTSGCKVPICTLSACPHSARSNLYSSQRASHDCAAETCTAATGGTCGADQFARAFRYSCRSTQAEVWHCGRHRYTSCCKAILERVGY